MDYSASVLLDNTSGRQRRAMLLRNESVSGLGIVREAERRRATPKSGIYW